MLLRLWCYRHVAYFRVMLYYSPVGFAYAYYLHLCFAFVFFTNLKKILTVRMICRDFMIRVCCRNECKMHHGVIICTNGSCNGNYLCKLVHLTKDEVLEINENVRPFREVVYNEMKRLAFLLRQSFPSELRTLYMLGECLWPCLSRGTVSSNSKSFLTI